MTEIRIAVIEDETPIRRGVADALRATGYGVVEAEDGRRGLDAATRPDVDLVLLDLRLPGCDGMEVLDALRKLRPAVPVIILTARGSEDDRVRGLQCGADDYVVKPFSARELLARVEAVLRRTASRPPEVQRAQLGRAVVDFQRREIRWGGRDRAELSETETVLLHYLVANRTRAVSRKELLSRVWGLQRVETRTIDMHIVRLRTKFRDPAGKPVPDAILTVRAQGYMAGPEWAVLEGAAP